MKLGDRRMWGKGRGLVRLLPTHEHNLKPDLKFRS
jgi:hypothetical protein